MKIEIGNKKYDVQVMESEEDKEKGLQDVNYLPENEGMLFIYEEPEEISFWMDQTPLPLDVIFINEDYEVISVHQGVPNSQEPMTEQNVMYVLEVNEGSGIKAGDELEFEDDEKSESKMLVLDENGNVQVTLEGGERIFSIKNTKVLIKMANRAYKSKKDSDYAALGNKVFKFLDIQDSNKAEYVSTPESKETKEE